MKNYSYPPAFADLHTHILPGVDDGAPDPSVMQEMLDFSHAEGTRVLCFTPHFHPGFFGETGERAAAAFAAARLYCSKRYPEIRLFLANELRYDEGAVSWLREGRCRTLNGRDRPLVDFLFDAERTEILSGMRKLLSAGYRPVLAHVERYENLKEGDVRAMVSDGVLLQINARSVLSGAPFRLRVRTKKLLAAGLVTLVASDAHDLGRRSPALRESYLYIHDHWGVKAAEDLFYYNGARLLGAGGGDLFL